MNNNDVLRSIRYALDLSEPAIADMIKSSGLEIDRPAAAALLKKEDEEGYVECRDEILSAFLDGLIVKKRGQIEPKPEQANKPSARLNNNTILKKLRIAFELKEDDVHGILEQAGFALSKPELNALFRKKGHKNYRECGDQILRNFLKGITLRYRS